MDPHEPASDVHDATQPPARARVPLIPRQDELKKSRPAKINTKLPPVFKGPDRRISPEIALDQPQESTHRKRRNWQAHPLRHSWRKFKSYFGHHRWGRARIFNLIVMPFAVLLAFLAIYILFKSR